jgi:hypothetical protein
MANPPCRLESARRRFGNPPMGQPAGPLVLEQTPSREIGYRAQKCSSAPSRISSIAAACAALAAKRENRKRYVIHVAAFNLGFLMRAPLWLGRPRKPRSPGSSFSDRSCAGLRQDRHHRRRTCRNCPRRRSTHHAGLKNRDLVKVAKRNMRSHARFFDWQTVCGDTSG